MERKREAITDKEFPMTSFPLYGLTLFLRASSQFCEVKTFLLASSKPLNNISGFQLWWKSESLLYFHNYVRGKVGEGK